jgi:lipopolysaccharide transport system permease protein
VGGAEPECDGGHRARPGGERLRRAIIEAIGDGSDSELARSQACDASSGHPSTRSTSAAQRRRVKHIVPSLPGRRAARFLQTRRYADLVQTDEKALPTPRPATDFSGGGTPIRRAVRWLRSSVDLLWALTESDLRFRYGRGPWRFGRWLLEPVALVGVYLFLITFVLDRPGKALGLSLACAVVPFQLVMLTIANAMTTLDARKPILLNMAFKRMLIPISSALTESAGFAASVFLLIFMMAAYGIGPSWNLAWFPLVLLVNLLLAVAAAYAATLFGVWLRELRPFILSFVRTLFFLGPGLVPLEETSEDVRDVLRLNPLTGLFEAYRDVFLNGQRPAAWELLYPLATVVVLLVVFVPIYQAEQRQFVKVI